MHNFLIVIVMFFISNNVIAADFSKEHIKEAEKFILIMNYKKTGETMKKNVENDYRKNLSKLAPPQIPNVNQSKVDKIFSDYTTAIFQTVNIVFDWKTMKPLYIRAIASTYTTDELVKLNNFFNQPGAKIFLSKQQILINNMMNIGNELTSSLLMPKFKKFKSEMMNQIRVLQLESIEK